jgi:hypothetical protein
MADDLATLTPREMHRILPLAFLLPLFCFFPGIYLYVNMDTGATLRSGELDYGRAS